MNNVKNIREEHVNMVSVNLENASKAGKLQKSKSVAVFCNTGI